MSTDQDTARLVRAWLREDIDESSDRVLDSVLEQIDWIPQRRPGWLARRFAIMSDNRLRLGIAAAAVVAAVFLGLRVLPPSGVGGPQSTPTPTPIPTPAPPIAHGALEAGTYLWSTEPYVSIEVPDGWDGYSGFAILNGESASEEAAIALFNATGITIYENPCEWAQSGQSRPQTVGEIAAALSVQLGRGGTEPADVTIGGVPGKHVRLTVPTDLSVEPRDDGLSFTDCDLGEYRSWSGRFHQGPGQIDEVYIVEADGTPLIFDVSYFPATSESDRADLEAMLESIRFDD